MQEKNKKQKVVYLSNLKDCTRQSNVNESEQFTHINELLGQGWNIARLATGITVNSAVMNGENETFAAFVVLERDIDEE